MRRYTIHAFALTLPLVALLVACGGSTEPQVDESRCPQTHEFGNSGCAVVAGLVTNSTRLPVAGAYVAIMGAADSLRPLGMAREYVQTDSAGRYRIRVSRFFPPPPASGPDTVSVIVRANVPPPLTDPAGTRGSADSMIVVLRWQPIGAVPDTAYVPTIALPIAES